LFDSRGYAVRELDGATFDLISGALMAWICAARTEGHELAAVVETTGEDSEVNHGAT
jgi:hypothetical protein